MLLNLRGKEQIMTNAMEGMKVVEIIEIMYKNSKCEAQLA